MNSFRQLAAVGTLVGLAALGVEGWAAYAQGKTLPSVTKQLTRMEKAASHGLHVARIRDGRTLYDHQGDKALVPASVMKILTSVAAFETWGAEHQFETPFSYSGTLKNGLLQGTLYVRGMGDPMLTNENLLEAAADLHALGLRRIQGHLVIDNSHFQTQSNLADRKRTHSQNAYDAPISAFGVNFNTIAIAVAPGAGHPGPLVSTYPFPMSHIDLTSKVTRNNGGTRLQVSRTTSPSGKDRLVASGRISRSADLKKVYRSLSDPLRASAAALMAGLHALGIDCQCQVRKGQVPKQAENLYTWKGIPLHRIVHGLNTYSNNYIADMLFLNLASANGQAGSFRGGAEALSTFITQRFPELKGLKIENGSGLGQKNRLTATSLTRILVWASKQLHWFPEFQASLPLAGQSGGLKDRFQKGTSRTLRKLLRGKTGTLSNPVVVSSLAGYIQHPTHGPLAFALIGNGRHGKRQPNILDLRQAQDTLLSLLTQAI